MQTGRISRLSLSVSAAALLAACGGSQQPVGAPGAMPQSRAIARHVAQGKSWMLPDATKDDLIYAAGQGSSYVFSFSTGALLGTIGTGAQSVCSDKSTGNVFLTGASAVYEYSHGGTEPIQTLNLPGSPGEPVDCAVDSDSGNVAVTFFEWPSDGPRVAIFPGAQGPPTIYQTDFDSQFCGYDNEGNLFIDGYAGHGSTALGELPKGGNEIFDIGLGGQDIGGNVWSIQWDGNYMTLQGLQQHSATINRLAISGSEATIVGRTTFQQNIHGARGSWIQGKTILMPLGWGNRHVKIGLWRYPQGGKAVKVFTKARFGQINSLNGLAISLTHRR